jgi:hypothetical protein
MATNGTEALPRALRRERPWRDFRPDQGLRRGAGEGNRTLTVSLGTVQVTLARGMIFQVGAVACGLERPAFAWANGPPMARTLLVDIPRMV